MGKLNPLSHYIFFSQIEQFITQGRNGFIRSVHFSVVLLGKRWLTASLCIFLLN
jgi:hypothetical protein